VKPILFKVMEGIIGDAKCEFIGEIGTHKGGTAKQFINLFAPRVEKLTYHGYDVFDFGIDNAEFHKGERNGKAAVKLTTANITFDKVKRKHQNIDIKLFKGFTTDTLETTIFDFVYIDGGHSYETVKHDYSKVKDSKIIVFDDCKIPGVRQVINEIKESGIDVEMVTTPSKHIWAVVRN
jgi:hypothetical protein